MESVAFVFAITNAFLASSCCFGSQQDPFPIMVALAKVPTFLLATIYLASTVAAFVPHQNGRKQATATRWMVAAKDTGKGYEPQWKKKETIGGGDFDNKDKGLIGTIPVVFKQGNETRSTVAIVGQPLSDVASQAGQFIKYGCGKGECGTCEALCNGKWIRPCVEGVPADLAPGEELVILIKELKSKSTSSGKFYSVRSFFMGFYNNLLGMVGFVKTRKLAKKNWEDRQQYEDLIRQKTLEKKLAKAKTDQENVKQ